MVGCFQTRGKPRSRLGNENKVVEGMKYRVRVLQREVEEMACIREKESRMYEQETLLLAIREAEWKKERKALKEQVNKLRNLLVEQRRRLKDVYCCNNHGEGGFDDDDEMMMMMVVQQHQQVRDHEAAAVDNRWKHLYFAIKLELDRLILTTNNNNNNNNQGERGCGRRYDEDMEKEVRAKEESIRLLESRIAFLEQQELRREREVDILRESLRIMFYNNNKPFSFHMK